MRRRDFLVLSLFAPFTPLVARAGGLDCPAPEARRGVVREGLTQARAAGKPLLVLVAPRQGDDGIRGYAFGQWLNHGGDAALADLAQVVVVVARAEDVAAEVPHTPRSERAAEPALYVVWDDKATPLNVLLEPAESERGSGTDADPAIDRNIQQLRAALRGALAKTRSQRVARCPQPVGTPETLSPEQVDGSAARLAELPGLHAALAEAARQRLVKARIPGSYWAIGGGCGELVEELPQSEQQLVKCGMGFVPVRSRRFIRFYNCAT